MGTRGQGLPIETIVVAAISFLVLVVLIIFFTGSFSKVFGQAKVLTDSVQAEVTAAQTKCATWCAQAQNLGSVLQKSSDFCTKTQQIDVNADGTHATDGSEDITCKKSPISSSCPSVTC